jgi:mRNA interferase MazF
MVKSYIPARGDIVWLNFDPQVGHEHSGHRPALVLSPSEYNERIGLMLCCPMTNQVKGYPFEVLVDGNPKKGAILSDQVKSMDWREREAEKKGNVTKGTLAEVVGKIKTMMED